MRRSKRAYARSSAVTPPDLIALFVVPLNQLGIDYFITGAVAAVVYGEPRLTRDLDVVLALRPGDAVRLGGAFPESAFYVPPLEVIEEEARRPRGGHFNIIHHGTTLRADCYAAGDDPLHAWALSHRRASRVGGVDVWIAPLEYVVVRKLEWHRDSGSSKHLEDVRAMVRVSGDHMDRGELNGWITRLGLEGQWALVEA